MKKSKRHILSDGTIEWGFDDNRSPTGYRLHRIDEPAVIYRCGLKMWCRNGKLHRKGAPATIDPDGTLCWLIDGRFHRTDGPAGIHSSGTVEWWLHGKQYSFSTWCNTMRLSKDERIRLKLIYG